MRIGSLCSGYGGLDLGAQAVLGGTVSWHVEYDPNASRILAHHWPHVPNLGDLTTVDWSRVEPVDVLTAGYPCQPFSHAGQRKGSTDVRHLWPYVARAISVLRPRLVLLENVRGHVSLGLDAVIGDLSRLGYDARWGIVRAADSGAPHSRARIFIAAAAHAEGDSGRLGYGDDVRAGRDQGRHESDTGRGSAAHADGQRHERPRAARGRWPGPADSDVPAADAESVSPGQHRNGGRLDRPSRRSAEADRHQARAGATGRGPVDPRGETPVPGGRRTDALAPPDRRRLEVEIWPTTAVPANSDETSAESWPTTSSRCTTRPGSLSMDGSPHESSSKPSTDPSRRTTREVWGPYEPAIARWERLTRPAPAPTEAGNKGQPRLSPRFVEWMMGLPDGHVTAVPGLTRNAQLKALGNGVVPAQAAAAFRVLLPALLGEADGIAQPLPRTATTLLPTPTAGDAKSSRNSTAARHKIPPTGIHAGNTLTDILVPSPGADQLRLA